MSETTETTETQISLTPSIGTYLRYVGVIASDVVAVAAIYQTFDIWLAVVLSIVVVALTIIAAWKNNSISRGAICCDAMMAAFTDAANAEEIKGAWQTITDAAHDIYLAIKQDKSTN